jgi:integrase
MRKPMAAAAVGGLKEPGRYAVGDGVSLQISKWHTRSWVFRYERFGRAHYMGLGPYPLISLAEARAKGRDARRLLLDGTDPLALRREKRNTEMLRQAREKTFEECAREYIAAHEAKWSPASSEQWTRSLEQYAFPIIGKLPVAEIDLPFVLKVIEPIWHTVSETASRVRNRIEAILGWATARGLRTGDNPARWSNHLQHLLPSRKSFKPVERFEAMPYKAVGSFLARLREESGIAARALEFTILTAARRGEVIGARWSEIDGDTWTVPAERMKAGREHRIPLSKPALELLADLPREGEFVFIGARAGRPLNHMTMRRVLEKLECKATIHGFRSTFRDWAAETTAYPNHVTEMALAHQISNAVEAAYRRGDLFDKRRRLMADWARYCGQASTENRAVPIRIAR